MGSRFLTGRTRTLEYAGTILCACDLFSGTVGGGTAGYSYGEYVSAMGPVGLGVVVDAKSVVFYTIAAGSVVETVYLSGMRNFDGHYSISMPAQEYREYTASDWDLPLGLQYTTCKIGERIPPGGTLIETVTAGTKTVTCNTIAGTAGILIPFYVLSQYAIRFSAGTAPAGTAFIGALLNGNNIGKALTHSFGNTTGDTTNGAKVIGGAGSCFGSVVTTIYPDQAFELAGAAREWADPYPGALGIRVNRKAGEADGHWIETASGTFAEAYAQEQYDVHMYLEGTSFYDTKTEQSDVSLELRHGGVDVTDPYGLLALGEDLRDYKVQMKGNPYDALTLQHAGSMVVDTNYNVVGPGTVTRTLGTVLSFASYRYLDFYTADPAVMGGYLTIGVKRFELGTVATADRLRADLCGPVNCAVSQDELDSRWPVSQRDTVTDNGVSWGVKDCGTYAISCPAGTTIHVSAVQLTRVNHALADFIQPYDTWYAFDPPRQKRPGLRGDTDGKRSLEEAYLEGVDGGIAAAPADTIGSIVACVNASGTAEDILATPGPRNYGWSSALVCGSVDGTVDYTAEGTAFLNSNRPASWLFGGGELADSAGWTYGIEQDAAGTIHAKAQPLFDVLLSPWPWDAGDAFGVAGTPAYGGAIKLRAGKTLRCQAWGLVYDSAMHVPDPPITVSAKELTQGNTVTAAGGTASMGEYALASTYLRAGENIYEWVLGGNLTFPAANRLRRRACFLSRSAVVLSYDVSECLRHYHAIGQAGGSAIYIGGATSYNAVSWADNLTAIAGSHVYIRARSRAVDQRLIIGMESGGAVVAYATADEGKTCVMAGTIAAAGRFPSIEITRDGRQFWYWIEGGSGTAQGTAIMGKMYDSQMNLLAGPFLAVAGSIDPGPCPAREYATQGGGWSMHLTYASNGAIIDVNSRDGTAFI